MSPHSPTPRALGSLLGPRSGLSPQLVQWGVRASPLTSLLLLLLDGRLKELAFLFLLRGSLHEAHCREVIPHHRLLGREARAKRGVKGVEEGQERLVGTDLLVMNLLTSRTARQRSASGTREVVGRSGGSKANTGTAGEEMPSGILKLIIGIIR